jgi:3-hydroxyisobutyrate dehydrogenase-like beta-hydroxyacid dehydrogenase
MATVAVMGLGAMGSRMARRLLSAGHQVVVWNRTPAKTDQLAELGAVPVRSPAEAARRAKAVITMVSDPQALREVSEGPGGIAAGVGDSTTIIEMSTVGPAAVVRLAAMLPDDSRLIDAPVLGSLAEAESGTLRIFVGGPSRLVEHWRPLLSVLGTPAHVGPLGAGAAAKLVANATLFGALGVLGEAVALGRGLGLSSDAVSTVLAATPLAAQAERRRPAMEAGEYPVRFALSLARKDAGLVLDAAATAGVDVRLAAAAHAWLVDADHAGRGASDYTAVLAHILTGGAGARLGAIGDTHLDGSQPPFERATRRCSS